MARGNQVSPDSTLTITDSAATTCELNLEGVDGGHFQISSGSVITITWHASVDGTTFKPCLDSTGTAVTQTVNTTNDFLLPTTLNGRNRVRPVAGSGTSGVLLAFVKRASQS